MPGLVPGIHVFRVDSLKAWMAGTSLNKSGHDASCNVTPQLLGQYENPERLLRVS
jgi:hypothetical protein